MSPAHLRERVLAVNHSGIGPSSTWPGIVGKHASRYEQNSISLYSRKTKAYLLWWAFAWIKIILPTNFFFLHLKLVWNHSTFAQRMVVFLSQNHVNVSKDQEKVDILSYIEPNSTLKNHLNGKIFLTTKNILQIFYDTFYSLIYIITRQIFPGRKIKLLETINTFSNRFLKKNSSLGKWKLSKNSQVLPMMRNFP